MQDDDDDDPPLALTGFIPVGDQDRMITQEELDRSAAFNGSVLNIFEHIPEDVVLGVILSVMATWALKFADPESAMAYLTEQAKQALPRLRAAQTETRQ